MVVSTGNVTWSSNVITPNSGVDIVVKLLQNSTGQVINLNLSYANFSSGVTLTNDGDVFYIELDRTKITGTNVTIYNGGGNVGQRAVTGSGLPPLVNNQSGGLQGTICIPLAIRQGTGLWWVHGNFYWANGTVGNLGTPGATSVMPVGTVTSFAGSAAPTGYLLCNGDTIPNGVGTVQGVTTNFSALYAIVGSNFGGAGKLPNCQGVFVRGVGTQTIGVKTYTASLGTKQNDSTALNGLNLTDPGHSHTYTRSVSVDPGWGPYAAAGGANSNQVSVTTSTTGITLSSSDTETRSANVALNYIIKY